MIRSYAAKSICGCGKSVLYTVELYLVQKIERVAVINRTKVEYNKRLRGHCLIVYDEWSLFCVSVFDRR